MTYQLRLYRVKDGEMERWITEWRDLVFPLREKMGFVVVDAWVARDTNRFIWIIGHAGSAAGFEEANDDYYESPDRKSMNPDPARLLDETETCMMESVLGAR